MSPVITPLKTGQSWTRAVSLPSFCFMLPLTVWALWSPFTSNIHFEEFFFHLWQKSWEWRLSAHGPLMTHILEALGNGFFVIFSGGWWSDCVSISCLELSYWHHSFPRSKAINLFFTFFPEEIIRKCLLGVFWQMCWSVVLHHWCFAVEF